MKEYVIIAELPEPLRSELAQLRAELDIWNSRWLPPHVTIVRPMVLELSDAIKAEIQRPMMLTAQLLKWAIFRNIGHNVLYLEPTPVPFERLRTDLFQRIPALIKRSTGADPHRQFADNPRYHVTIASAVPDDEIDRLLSKVSPVRAGSTKDNSQNSIPDGVLDPVSTSKISTSSNGVSQKTFMNVFQIHNLSLYSKESPNFWQIER